MNGAPRNRFQPGRQAADLAQAFRDGADDAIRGFRVLCASVVHVVCTHTCGVDGTGDDMRY